MRGRPNPSAAVLEAIERAEAEQMAGLVAQREEIRALCPVADGDDLQSSLEIFCTLREHLEGLPAVPAPISWHTRRCISLVAEIEVMLRAAIKARGAIPWGERR